MSTILEPFSSDTWSRLVMVLVHSLWQGGLVALLLWWFISRTPARRANARYAAALASLLAVTLGVFLTYWILGVRDATQARRASARSAQASQEARLQNAGQHWEQREHTLSAMGETGHEGTRFAGAMEGELATPKPPGWAAWAAMAWLAGCGIMSIRLLGQWLDLQRITRLCRPVAEANIEAILARLQGMLGVKQGIRILSGNHITGPSVYGMIAPTLLLPPALLMGVPAEQLEAIIAHELAHIRRHDYLVNLAQQVVEAALFFNPAVWWINRQIRIEREACCDQLAVAVTGKREAYAWSLKTWAEKQREAAVLLAPAFGAERHPSGPLERLKRLLVSEYRPAVRLPWHSFAGVLLVGGVLFFGLSQGTRLAVGYAAELLTPAQRLEKLDEIKKNYGYRSDAASEVFDTDKITVSGTVEGENGWLVGTNISNLTIVSKSRNYSSFYGAIAKNGRFELKARAGKIYLAVSVPDCAPALLGPYEGKPKGRIEGVRAILRAGYSARIKAVDEQGLPVAGAEISLRYQHPAAGNSAGDRITGADGIAVFHHLVTNAMHFQIKARGYEYDECEMPYLKPGDPHIWKLTAAKPAPGTVIASQSCRRRPRPAHQP